MSVKFSTKNGFLIISNGATIITTTGYCVKDLYEFVVAVLNRQEYKFVLNDGNYGHIDISLDHIRGLSAVISERDPENIESLQSDLRVEMRLGYVDNNNNLINFAKELGIKILPSNPECNYIPTEFQGVRLLCKHNHTSNVPL